MAGGWQVRVADTRGDAGQRAWRLSADVCVDLALIVVIGGS